jgi:xanthine dehydrogenase small subunit
MRDHLLIYVNGQCRRVSGSDAFLALSDYLRLRLGLMGTKIVCSEGDCGSCTVLVGRPNGDHFDYRPVDSCIQRMFQLDGAHIVTVEGLAGDGGDCELTQVQQAMVDCHGSQCGFCTPGFVVAMTGLLEENTTPGEDDWRTGLTGNLCRCTGYVPILEAGQRVDVGTVTRLNEQYDSKVILGGLAKSAREPIEIAALDGTRARQFHGPTTLQAALEILATHPRAKVVAGATDVGVQLNKGVIDPDVFLDLNRVPELTGLVVESTAEGDAILAGARATCTELAELTRDTLPEFHRIVSIFGAPQIRHVGTIGGNIINASPIADSLPLLMVAEAELELASRSGTRTVSILDFYQGYKKFDLRPGELLTRIRIPLPEPDVLLRLVKVSRRRDLDIATFTAAIWMRLDGEQIAEARIAFGACGPTVIRARRTEEYLVGQPFDEETMRAAGQIAANEISPISDVRGSVEFRRQLACNVLVKFYLEQALATV